jgi:hypothetical protein
MRPAFLPCHLLAFLLAFAATAWLTGCASTPLAPEDKALFVMAADLEPVGAELPSAFVEFEKTGRTRRIDGGLELLYEFDARAAGKGYPYIYATINHETTVSSAVAAYGAVKAGLGLANLEARDDSERFRYGDWSYFGTLPSDEGAHGFVFYMRDDLTVYTSAAST